jgi:hypothetical protein
VIASVAWKEYREHRPVWVAMVLVATVLLIFITQLLPALGLVSAGSESVMQLMVAAAGSVLTYGIVCGSMMLAGERELNTLAFLDALTGRRFPVWAAKLLPGALFCLLQGLFVAGLTLAVAPAATHTDWFIKPWHGLILLPIIALDAFIWGLLASALCRSVLTAAGVAALLWLLGWLFVVPCSAFHFPPMPFLGRFVLDGVALLVSALLFCQTETTERIVAAVPAPPRRNYPRRPPRAATVLLWLSLRQGWVTALVLGGLAMFLGLFLPAAGPLLWVSFTLVVGILCGTSVFGREQTEGSSQFLGNQRFPAGLVWGVKIASWLGIAVVVSLLFLVMGFVCQAAIMVRPAAAGAQSSPVQMFLGRLLENANHWHVIAPLGLLYGFGIGQFYALLWRKHVVAVVIGLLVAPGFAFIWLPSLAFGGLHLWQVIVPPLVLLAATRFVLWTWTGSGLAAWRPGLILAGCGLLSLCWISGMLSYRFLEIPGYPDLVDTEVYKKELPQGDRNPAGIRIGTAGDAFSQRISDVRRQKVLPPQFVGGEAHGPETSGQLAQRLAQAIEKGWPKHDLGLGDWLEAVFAPPMERNQPPNNAPAAPAELEKARDSWLEMYRKANTLGVGVVESPLLTNLERDLPAARRCADATVFIEARALQLQARGDSDEALDHLLLLLDLSRQLRNYALAQSYRSGWLVEETALHGLDLWLTHPRTAEQLRRALEHLNRHEEAVPPLSMAVEAEYVRMREVLNSGAIFGENTQSPNASLSTSEKEMLDALWFAPWERQRYHRVLNALAEAGRRAAQCDPREALEVLSTWQLGDIRDWHGVAALERGLTLLEPSSRTSAAVRWGRLLSDNIVAEKLPLSALRERIIDAMHQCHVRAMRLKLALLLHQVETGETAPSLDVLVKRHYLASVPPDPFDGQPFRYRISAGNDILWGQFGEDPIFGDVAPGQGILWSVGLDGVDQGGTRQGRGPHGNAIHPGKQEPLDFIFLVPKWR